MKHENKNMLDQIKDIENKTDAEKKRTLMLKRAVAIGTVLITIGLFVWLGFYIADALMLSYDSDQGITAAAGNFKNMIEAYGNWGILVSFGIQVLQVVVSPIPGAVIEVGMGLCYGWLIGSLICIIGGALGAVIIMLFVRKFGFKIVELFVSLDKINELKFINSEKKLERTVFLLYFIPGTPKDPLIFFFGLTKIKIRDFVIISTLARTPAIVATAIGGKFLVDQNYLGAVLIFAITAFISIFGMLGYKFILKHLQDKQEQKKLDNKEDK